MAGEIPADSVIHLLNNWGVKVIPCSRRIERVPLTLGGGGGRGGGGGEVNVRTKVIWRTTGALL